MFHSGLRPDYLLSFCFLISISPIYQDLSVVSPSLYCSRFRRIGLEPLFSVPLACLAILYLLSSAIFSLSFPGNGPARCVRSLATCDFRFLGELILLIQHICFSSPRRLSLVSIPPPIHLPLPNSFDRPARDPAATPSEFQGCKPGESTQYRPFNEEFGDICIVVSLPAGFVKPVYWSPKGSCQADKDRATFQRLELISVLSGRREKTLSRLGCNGSPVPYFMLTRGEVCGHPHDLEFK